MKHMTDAEGVSIVIPVYKVEPYLNRCIQSIVEQSYADLEIILVDDGSPDACPAMCDEWAGKDEIIKVIHKPNGGLSDARNAGMSAAEKEYVAFIDSDDWIAPEFIERLVQACENDGSDISACAVVMVWEDGRPQKLLTVRTNAVLDREEAQEALLSETLLKQPVWYKLYKRGLVCDIPFETGKQHEDVFWSYQALGKAAQVSVIDYPGYYYLQRTSSIMGAGYSLTRLDAAEAVRRRYEYIRQEFPSLEKKARLSVLSNCIYHGQMALKYLDHDERNTAFEFLEEIKNHCEYSHSDYRDRKLAHRLWFDLGRLSLPMVCRVKNALHVGL